ncbi:MAG: GNAT family N-acetyltransferase [Candidatus Hodarchaeota archaeon]
MGALRKVQMNIGEIKRMFILPEFRGNGFGKVLLEKLLEKGKEFGCSTFILDTGKFMKSAQHIYRLAGFQNSPEYSKSEVPKQLRHLCLFMKKNWIKIKKNKIKYLFNSYP